MSETIEAPAPARPANFTADVMCEKYVALRDKVTEIKKRHTDELSPYHQAMGKLEAWMIDLLNTSGADSMKTGKGTFFKVTRTSASVKEWPLTLAFIKEHEMWDLLEARVSKTAVEAIIEETKAPIPGVTLSRDTSLNVRRA